MYRAIVSGEAERKWCLGMIKTLGDVEMLRDYDRMVAE